MKWLLLSFLLLTTVVGLSQSLTGTWMGSFERGMPGNSRVFFYRFQLVQEADSIVGICEALDAQTDLRGMDPGGAAVVARFLVAGEVSYDGRGTRLIVSRALDLVSNAGSVQPPTFSEFLLTIVADPVESASVGPLNSSFAPASDGNLGRLSVHRTSTDRPDLDLTGFETAGRIRIPFKIFGRKNVKKVQSSEEAVADAFIPWHKRRAEQQASMQTDLSRVGLRLYDNGVVDDDTVSIYLNGRLLIGPVRLQATAMSLEADISQGRNEFVLVAHNMGSIAPNTALAVVLIGDQRFELNLSADLQKNALVLINKVEAGTVTDKRERVSTKGR